MPRHRPCGLLADRFRALRPALVASEATAPPSGVLDRIAASASSLVKVRPVAAQAGSDVTSVSSRIEAALQHDDLDAAITEASSLPEKAKVRAADWINEAKARQAGLLALRALEGDALKMITAPP